MYPFPLIPPFSINQKPFVSLSNEQETKKIIII